MTTESVPDPELISWSRRAWGALESLHVLGYFAEELKTAYTDLGLHPRLSYFAARSAALGPVGPGVSTATFYVFAPWLHAKALPVAWQIASPERVQQARRDGMRTVLDRVIGAQDLTELIGLARTVCEGLTAPGRPLYAAHAGLDWPDEPNLTLWHAATLIREHRGDGHVAALLGAGIDPVEALVLGGLFAGNTEFVRTTRGWTPQEWAAAEDRLTARGLLADAVLTDAGRTFRQDIEDTTDRLALAGWAHLGLDGTRRVHELAAPLQRAALDSDILPTWIRSRGSA